MKIILNPDESQVQQIRELLKKNDGYCPCVVTKNDATRCMCQEFKEQELPGECHCGLYIKVEEQ